MNGVFNVLYRALPNVRCSHHDGIDYDQIESAHDGFLRKICSIHALHGHLVYGPSRRVVRCESVAIGHLADKAEAYRKGGRAVEGLISRIEAGQLSISPDI